MKCAICGKENPTTFDFLFRDEGGLIHPDCFNDWWKENPHEEYHKRLRKHDQSLLDNCPLIKKHAAIRQGESEESFYCREEPNCPVGKEFLNLKVDNYCCGLSK